MLPISLPDSPPTALSPIAGPPSPERLDEVVDEFAGLFVRQMLQAMRKAAHVSGPPSLGTETFESMMDEEIARSVARSQDLGLSRLLADDFLQKT